MINPYVSTWRSHLVALTIGFGLTISGQAHASYPEKPIHVIVPFAAGSGTDISARKLASLVSQSHGWNFIIDNRPGANGSIAARTAADAAPDGYTLFYTGNTTHGANSALYKKLPYDPVADFEPVLRTGVFPLALIARPTLEVSSVEDLLKRMRESETPLTFAESSAGPLVAAGRFLDEADVKATRVPYTSPPQSLVDIIGGHVDFMFMDTVMLMPMIEKGTLRPLALTSRQRVKRLPDVPTLDEVGFPAFEVQNWSAIFVPDGTPTDVIQTLHDAFAPAVLSEDWQGFVTGLGAYADVLTPQETAEWVQAELRQYREVLPRVGVFPE
ncbi:MAG: Bug family tripartite tricarboxylate transporter substrate binding protein [Pigmentiphaga sp.]